MDGYVWQTTTAQGSVTEGAAMPEEDADFAALAARRVILAEMQRQRGKLDDPATLDRCTPWQKQQSIVTPYSSMIVLVTERQENLLEQLSELDDRYQREVEALGETSPSTQLPLSGVPEPEEWLLIGLALALAGYVWITRGAHRLHLSVNPLRIPVVDLKDNRRG